MKYKKGDRVRHPSKPEWGLGEVLINSNGETVKIFFVGGGEKIISLSPEYTKPEISPIDQASHPVLDNLKVSKSDSIIKYKSLASSIHYFSDQFPGEFYGARFNEEERDYKDKANKLAKEILGREEFSLLLENSDYSEIARLALKLVNKTNLISPFEKMALKDGLNNQKSKEVFAKTLNNLLYGDADLEPRFDRFIKILEDINASKWTVVSYFLFIFQLS